MTRHPRGLVKFAIMERTVQKVDALWEQMQKYARWCLTDTHNSKEMLVQNLMNPHSLYYDVLEDGRTVGFLSYHLESPWVAVGHALMFDGVMRGREKQVRKLNERLLKEYGWALIRSYLPVEHGTSIAWAKRLGFGADGVMRGSILVGGQPRDLLILTFPATHRFPVPEAAPPRPVAPVSPPQFVDVEQETPDTSHMDALEYYLERNGGPHG